MRFEHNLPVLVQLHWLPVGGPYAAFNLPVPFSPMSIGVGGRFQWPESRGWGGVSAPPLGSLASGWPQP